MLNDFNPLDLILSKIFPNSAYEPLMASQLSDFAGVLALAGTYCKTKDEALQALALLEKLGLVSLSLNHENHVLIRNTYNGN